MAKLTPPGPQHPKKRLDFFLKHLDHPGAKKAVDDINNHIISMAQKEYREQRRRFNKEIGKVELRPIKEIADKIAQKFYADWVKSKKEKK